VLLESIVNRCVLNRRVARGVPASSGLGNWTVGNSGSGSCCSFTGVNGLKPKRSKLFSTNTWPTPCMDVLTNLTSVDVLRPLGKFRIRVYRIEEEGHLSYR
jgi:hypothetical protein